MTQVVQVEPRVLRAPNGGDCLVSVLERFGVDCVFGVVSVHNLPLVDAVARRLRFVAVRTEAAAVNAADGYGRVRGGLGVALTSTGTGAGNAAGALVESLAAASSLLHVTGQIETEHLGRGRGAIHETRDQLAMLRAVSVDAHTILDADSASQVLHDAASAAVSTPGPVSVEWPIDLQYGEPRRSEVGQSSTSPNDPVPSDDDIDRAADLLARARRPLVWCGGGARADGALVSALLDRLGAGLLTSNAGRGVVPEDDPRCIGNFAASSACASLLGDADLLLTIGSHLRATETKQFELPLPSEHVQIDIDQAALGRSYPARVGLAGRAELVLPHLLDRLQHLPVPTDDSWVRQVAETRAAVRVELRAAIGPQGLICDAIRTVLPRDAVIARDVTIPSSTWGNRLLEIYDPRSNVYAHGGGIGQGLPMGIGASIARPDVPVLVLVGDGGLSVALGELLTLVAEQPWIVLVVFNDRGYGVIRNMQDRHVGRRSGVDLVTPDFGGLAEAMGLPHTLVTDAKAFHRVLADAVEQRRPTVVEVDVDAIGAMPRPFIPPVRLPLRR